MDKIRSILQQTFSESLGMTGEQRPVNWESGQDIKPPERYKEGPISFRYTVEHPEKEMNKIKIKLDELGVKYLNVDKDFKVVSMTITQDIEKAVVDLFHSINFSFSSVTWGDEMRAGKHTTRSFAAPGTGGYGASGGGFSAFPAGYQLTRLVGESKETKKS
jgi:hypothetical protein